MTRHLIRAAITLALVSTLGGCGVLSLVGGGKPKNPAQLYRFPPGLVVFDDVIA